MCLSSLFLVSRNRRFFEWIDWFTSFQQFSYLMDLQFLWNLALLLHFRFQAKIYLSNIKIVVLQMSIRIIDSIDKYLISVWKIYMSKRRSLFYNTWILKHFVIIRTSATKTDMVIAPVYEQRNFIILERNIWVSYRYEIFQNHFTVLDELI